MTTFLTSPSFSKSFVPPGGKGRHASRRVVVGLNDLLHKFLGNFEYRHEHLSLSFRGLGLHSSLSVSLFVPTSTSSGPPRTPCGRLGHRLSGSSPVSCFGSRHVPPSVLSVQDSFRSWGPLLRDSSTRSSHSARVEAVPTSPVALASSAEVATGGAPTSVSCPSCLRPDRHQNDSSSFSYDGSTSTSLSSRPLVAPIRLFLPRFFLESPVLSCLPRPRSSPPSRPAFSGVSFSPVP